MAVTYSNALKDTRMTDVINAIDASGAGSLEICDAGYADVLCPIPLDVPSFTEANQAITLNGVPLNGYATAPGTAALARIKDANGNIVVQDLTVGTSGTDFILSSTDISVGQIIMISSGVITHG